MITLNAEHRTWPVKAETTFTGSAWTACVRGVPESVDGYAVSGVEVRVVNADGIPFAATCVKRGKMWTATFSAACFERFGKVAKGVRVRVVGDDGGGVNQTWTFAVADFEVVADSPEAHAGDPGAAYVVKGGDVYVKSREVTGVQHYVKQRMVYDEDMAAWGAEWDGDYVLKAGEFVEVSHA